MCWRTGAVRDVAGSRWTTRRGGCLLQRAGSGGSSGPGGRRGVAVRKVFQLLVEDIIEEVEVVVEEEQGKLPLQDQEQLEEQGQENPRTGASSDQPPLEALEALAALQVHLSSPNEKDPTAYLWLQRNDHQRRKRPLSQRSTISQGIPGLWPKAVSLVLLLRGQMLRRTRRNRSRRRGGCEGTRQLR